MVDNITEAKIGEKRSMIEAFKKAMDQASFALSPDGKRIVLGDDLGQVLLVFLENLEPFPAVVTPFMRFDELLILCPFCQKITKVEKSSIGHEILCPSCSRKIKLNAFY